MPPLTTTCPAWCTDPGHRAEGPDGDPHFGPVPGSTTTDDVYVELYAESGGGDGVTVYIGGDPAMDLPSTDAAARLAAMADALRAAAEGLTRAGAR